MTKEELNDAIKKWQEEDKENRHSMVVLIESNADGLVTSRGNGLVLAEAIKECYFKEDRDGNPSPIAITIMVAVKGIVETIEKRMNNNEKAN